MIENEQETSPLKASKRLIQVERGEIFHREEIKYTFAYALIGTVALVIVAGTLLSVGGMGYTLVQQLKK